MTYVHDDAPEWGGIRWSDGLSASLELETSRRVIGGRWL
jgi:hypothetical protein